MQYIYVLIKGWHAGEGKAGIPARIHATHLALGAPYWFRSAGLAGDYANKLIHVYPHWPILLPYPFAVSTWIAFAFNPATYKGDVMIIQMDNEFQAATSLVHNYPPRLWNTILKPA